MDFGLWALGWALASTIYSVYRKPNVPKAESLRPKAWLKA